MTGLNVVVDLSHHNKAVDLVRARQAGVLGVIHKATQGTGYRDPTFADRRTAAAAAGLMWGAYHFGVAGSADAQVDHFLAVVAPEPTDLLVLDIEENPGGPSMTLAEAEAFVTRVHEKTGRWPGLYGGHYLKGLLGSTPNATLAQCWLWMAQYGPKVTVPAAWPTWTMWQYTDGEAGPEPHTVDGIGHCDRDRFNGDRAALGRLWGHPAVATTPAFVTEPSSPLPAGRGVLTPQSSLSTGGSMSRFNPWALTALVALILLAAYIALSGRAFDPVTFKAFDAEAFTKSLAPLLVVSLLIERTIEMLFGVWRAPGDRIAVAQAQAAQRAMGVIQPQRAVVEGAVSGRRAENTRLAFVLNGTLAVVVALTGVRVLALLIEPCQAAWGCRAGAAGSAPGWWQLIDVVLTAGLLGGGAEGFHHLTQLLTTFLKASQTRAADLGNPPPPV